MNRRATIKIKVAALLAEEIVWAVWQEALAETVYQEDAKAAIA